jgi:hypothetical protein
MPHNQSDIPQLLEQCRAAMSVVLPPSVSFDEASENTRDEYKKLGCTLLRRAAKNGGRLSEVLLDTQRPSTFHKRMAAMRFCLWLQHVELRYEMRESALREGTMGGIAAEFKDRLQKHLDWLTQYHAVRCQGLPPDRQKRKSKRQALRGLPPHWRESLCSRGAAGKYSAALLAAALSGCRPAELVAGVYIWRDFDETEQKEVINIDIAGAKVKARQGQPRRIIHFPASDNHPLIESMNQLLDQQDEPALKVQIANAGNFTVEIRRLSKCLWPAHPQAITAYCLRHQWSADTKRTQSGDSVSRGLGHASAKTRRNYGQAQQASKAGALRPLAVTVERSIKPLSTTSPLLKARASVAEPEMP